MNRDAIATRAISRIAEDYRRRGFDVIERPSPAQLPPFLTGYRADLIARGEDQSVVIDVKVGTETSVAGRFQEIAARVNQQPGWRYGLVYVDPSDPDQLTEAEPAPLPDLERRAHDAESVLRAGQPEAAFLLLWSAAEGVLRLLGRRAALPVENLPSSALIRELYSTGEISRTDFDTLIRLLPIRNNLTHGFSAETADVSVEDLKDVTNSLLHEVRTA